MRVAMYHGDCLEVLGGLRPHCVDLVVTSPPYADKRTYGIGYASKGKEWVRECADRFEASLRVSRGAVCWVVGHGASGAVRPWWPGPALLIAELHRRGVHQLRPLWYKRHGVPGAGGPQWFAPLIEWIVCGTSAKGGKLPYARIADELGHAPKFDVGGAMSYRRQDGARVNAHKIGYRTKRAGRGDTGDGARVLQKFKQPTKCNPGDVFDLGAVGGGRIGDTIAHENEAPFPEALVEKLVLSLCPPGGTVLDPYAGSGTVGKVAAMHGRNAVLIDIRAGKGGLNTARRRIEAFNAANPDKAARIVWPNRRATA